MFFGEGEGEGEGFGEGEGEGEELNLTPTSLIDTAHSIHSITDTTRARIMYTDFLPYSILSGTLAALASVSAKLFSDSRTLSFTIYVCEAVYASGCENVENGVCKA